MKNVLFLSFLLFVSLNQTAAAQYYSYNSSNSYQQSYNYKTLQQQLRGTPSISTYTQNQQYYNNGYNAGYSQARYNYTQQKPYYSKPYGNSVKGMREYYGL